LVIIGAADFFGAGVLTLVELLEVAGDAAGSGVDTIGAVGVFDAGFNSAYATPLAITKPIPSNAICDFIISVWLRFLN
jgi:hypothetical protein